MLKHTRLDSPYIQYIIGLCVNILVVAILLGSDVTYNNTQIPEGEIQEQHLEGKRYLFLCKNGQKLSSIWCCWERKHTGK